MKPGERRPMIRPALPEPEAKPQRGAIALVMGVLVVIFAGGIFLIVEPIELPKPPPIPPKVMLPPLIAQKRVPPDPIDLAPPTERPERKVAKPKRKKRRVQIPGPSISSSVDIYPGSMYSTTATFSNPPRRCWYRHPYVICQ